MNLLFIIDICFENLIKYNYFILLKFEMYLKI